MDSRALQRERLQLLGQLEGPRRRPAGRLLALRGGRVAEEEAAPELVVMVLVGLIAGLVLAFIVGPTARKEGGAR